MEDPYILASKNKDSPDLTVCEIPSLVAFVVADGDFVETKTTSLVSLGISVFLSVTLGSSFLTSSFTAASATKGSAWV